MRPATPSSRKATRAGNGRRHTHAISSFASRRSGGSYLHRERNEKGVAMGESIRDLMTSNPRSLESGSSAVEAARIMRDEDTGIVPIVEGDRLVGTVTDRDITVRVVAEGK